MLLSSLAATVVYAGSKIFFKTAASNLFRSHITHHIDNVEQCDTIMQG